jgi:hypothetical protein
VSAAEKAHLAALEEIGDGGGSFAGIAAAARDGENKIAERKLGPVDFTLMFFHKGNSDLIGTPHLLATSVPFERGSGCI